MQPVRVFGDSRALSAAAADEVVRLAEEALAERETFSLVLSGGRTPREAYSFLATGRRAGRVDWSRVRFLWGDERCVSVEDPESNFGMAWSILLSKVPHMPELVHRIPVELGAERAAAAYDRTLRQIAGGETPALDLVLLGLGEDGHAASLFPGSPALDEERMLAAAAVSPRPPAERVTLTPPAIRAARHVLFLVGGVSKAPALAGSLAALDGTASGPPPPAARLRPAGGRLHWFVDRAAAEGLRAPEERRP